VDFSNVTTLEMDVTMLVDNFASGTWTKVGDKPAINNDLGWREIVLTEAINRDTNEPILTDWGTWFGDKNRKLIWDIEAAGFDWTGLPDSNFVSILISVQGAGIFHFDNILVERLWRTVKYEDVYLRQYDDGNDLIRSLREYFDYYNYHRPHRSLGGSKPVDVYQTRRHSLRSVAATPPLHEANVLDEMLQLIP